MKRLQNDMFACGAAGLPQTITIQGKPCFLETVFKHDFFACTGKYICPQTQQRFVLKVSRHQPFFGIGCQWIGRWLRNREMKLLAALQDLDQVPRVIQTVEPTGFVYGFIEGRSLDERNILPDNFFHQLTRLLSQLHQRDICYLDLNKRGNILCGQDDRPHLIDFQISMRLPGKIMAKMRSALQKEDFYHLLKQKKRLRPDLMKPHETQHLSKISPLIRLHRFVSVPLRNGRRRFLRALYRLNFLSSELTTQRTPENDPTRFLR